MALQEGKQRQRCRGCQGVLLGTGRGRFHSPVGIEVKQSKTFEVQLGMSVQP